MVGVTLDESSFAPPSHRQTDADHQPMRSANVLPPSPSPLIDDDHDDHVPMGEHTPHPPHATSLRQTSAVGPSPHPPSRRRRRQQRTITDGGNSQHQRDDTQDLKVRLSRKRTGPTLRAPAQWRVIARKRLRCDVCSQLY